MLISKILNPILSLSRSKRLVILLLLDFSIIIFSFYLSIWLSVSNNIIYKLNNISILIIFILSLISLGVYYKSGQYRSLTRYIGSKSFYKLLLVNFLVSFIFYFSNYLYIYKFDFRFYLIFWILISFLTVSVRVLIRDFILRFKFFITSKRKIVIYGAGRSGAKLLKNLNFDPEFEVKFIIDDDSSLWNKNIDGIEILPPVKLKEHRNSIDLILMSIPSLNRKNIFKRFMEISKYKIPIFQFPSISQISSGEAVPSHLKEITLDYLLGRNVVQSKKNFINDYFLKKTVLITGGGGSIGRELCRQVAKLKPRNLIIIDHSEENLYNIEKELRNDEYKNINIISFLGNVTKEQFVNNIFKKNKIDVIFHAAAYKHVPIVEENIIEGVLNNILSTSVLCEASKNFGVDKFILISSDKAVRPTNIMGASKRIAEMIVQIYSQENNTLRNIDDANKISFSMVRFGNVLGSSGSVVPLFNSQIKSGGPVTLTDKDVVRYFMTIEESVLLVIQSASMANGGEVFLLDMGYPVKIIDLAKNMIHLSGLTIKNNKNPNGDIEIVTTGLRKGEKMYEELLIDSKSVKTIHPLIFKAIEKKIDINKFKVLIQDLYKALQNADEINVRELIKKLVPESNIKNYL